MTQHDEHPIRSSNRTTKMLDAILVGVGATIHFQSTERDTAIGRFLYEEQGSVVRALLDLFEKTLTGSLDRLSEWQIEAYFRQFNALVASAQVIWSGR